MLTQSKVGFNVYDIFWYIAPGGALLMGLYIYHLFFGIEIFSKISVVLKKADKDFIKWVQDAGLITIALFLMYAIGHSLFVLSSALIDKLLVERIMGHPYLRLFNTVYNKDVPFVWYMKTNQTIYKHLISFAIVATIFYFKNWKIALYVLIALFVILLTVKIVFTNLALNDIFNPLSVKKEKKKADNIANIFKMKIFATIPFFIDSIFSVLFRMFKPFEISFQNEFSKRFEKTFNIPMEELATNVFWLPYSYLCRNNQNSFELISYLQRLFSFLQNMSAVFLLLFIYGISDANSIDPGKKDIHNLWSMLTGMGCVILVLRYYYLYYNYYSKSVFRVFYEMTGNNQVSEE
ncbi:MAG: hypothetical protein JEZ07_16165 [Phycisphaerae bacterium]|nr:hypothetical protein [Phycisphaerae bacterium]